MQSFQRSAWEERAWARYERQRKSGTGPKARARLDEDLVAIAGIAAVASWCEKRGISITFTNRRDGGLLSPDEKMIQVNSTQTYERQLFVLLHEAGHLLIGSHSPSNLHRFRLGYPSAHDPDLNSKFVHRCAILEEEFEAWHRGRRLARKLQIAINEDRWNETKAEFLKTYIKWSLRAKAKNNSK